MTELSVIRHEPDNRFLECALAADAELIVTVNTARGHFDRKQYQTVRVVTPGEFLNIPELPRLLKKLTDDSPRGHEGLGRRRQTERSARASN